MEKFARISPPSSLCQGLFDALGVRPGALVCSYDSSEPGRDFVGAQDARSTAPQSLWTVDFARAPLLGVRERSGRARDLVAPLLS